MARTRYRAMASSMRAFRNVKCFISAVSASEVISTMPSLTNEL